MPNTFQQKEQGFMTYPSGGWRKWMFKSPVQLWRLGLEPIIGRMMLLITHTGRKSGLPRRTMAEYYRLDGRKYVVAAFGHRAQWCQNMLADPRVTIQTSDGVERARAVRVFDDDELRAVVNLFLRRDPPLTKRYLASVDIREDLYDLIEKKERTYFFRFDPTDETTPEPLKSDLVWVWLLLSAGILLAGWVLAQRNLSPKD